MDLGNNSHRSQSSDDISLHQRYFVDIQRDFVILVVMTISSQSTGLVGDPKRLLLDLAGHHHVSELLPLAVQRLAEGPAIALVRIWLVQPPLPDDCANCRLAAECQNRDRCLHLVASAGQSARQHSRTLGQT